MPTKRHRSPGKAKLRREAQEMLASSRTRRGLPPQNSSGPVGSISGSGAGRRWLWVVVAIIGLAAAVWVLGQLH